MPSWVDLTKNNATLNVQTTPGGKVLLLRAIGGAALPPSVTALGFVQEGEHYTRSDLRFTLAQIRQHFPDAITRDHAPAEILYRAPTPAAAHRLREPCAGGLAIR